MTVGLHYGNIFFNNKRVMFMSRLTRVFKWLLIAYVVGFVLFHLGTGLAAQVRRVSYVRAHPELSPEIRQAILRGRVLLGMTEDELEASWGRGRVVVCRIGWGIAGRGEKSVDEDRVYHGLWRTVRVRLHNGSVVAISPGSARYTAALSSSVAEGKEPLDRDTPAPPADLEEEEVTPLEELKRDVGPLPFLEAFTEWLRRWQEPGTRLTALTVTEYPAWSSRSDRYLIAVFSGSRGVLEVYKVVGKRQDKLRLLGKKVFEHFTELYLKQWDDMNRDGAKEIVIEGWNGGNCWQCSGLAIYQIRDDQLIQISPNLPYSTYEDGFFRGRIDDLDGDGREELLIRYNRFEFAFNFSHGASPIAWRVYTWKGCYYGDASTDFGYYYDEQIRKLRKSAEEANRPQERDPDGNLEGYVSDLISILINRVLKGEGEEGWHEFSRAIDTPEFHRRWERYREDYPVFPSLDKIIAAVRRTIFEDDPSEGRSDETCNAPRESPSSALQAAPMMLSP